MPEFYGRTGRALLQFGSYFKLRLAETGWSFYILLYGYALARMYCFVKLIEVYKCLCDETRLRILHLLAQGPLCVCHFQKILSASQVKISKHLAYLREHGLVESQREGAWIVYSLPAKPSPELTANMKCLQDCCRESAVFTADLRRMTKALANCAGPLADCRKLRSKAKTALSIRRTIKG